MYQSRKKKNNIITVLLVLLLLTGSTLKAQEIIEGYIVRLMHTLPNVPEYSLKIYFFVDNESLKDYRRFKKKSDVVYNFFIKNGFELAYPTIANELISCCEGSDIYQGYENYKSGSFSDSLIHYYQEQELKVKNIIDSMTVNLLYKDERDDYKLAIYSAKLKGGFCWRLLGTVDEKYLYIRDFLEIRKANKEEIKIFKTIFGFVPR